MIFLEEEDWGDDGGWGDDGHGDGVGGRGGFRGRGGWRGPRGRGMRRPGFGFGRGFGPPGRGFGPPGTLTNVYLKVYFFNLFIGPFPPFPRGRGFGPRGPPPGWDPNFGPPMGGPWGPGPMGPGGPGPMGPPRHFGPGPGWDHGGDEGEEEYMEEEHGGGNDGDAGGPDQDKPEDIGIDLSGEIWVETPADGGKVYYYNAATRATQWTKPEGPDIKVLTQDEVEKLQKKMNDGGDKDPGKAESDMQGSAGEFNNMGGPPQFGGPVMPPFSGPPGGPGGPPPPWGMPPWGGMAPGPGGPGMPPPWMGPPGPGMGPSMGAPPKWSEHTSPEGKKYYYNSETQESVWEKPQEMKDWEVCIKCKK